VEIPGDGSQGSDRDGAGPEAAGAEVSPWAALPPAALFTALIAWFAWERGGYFGVVLLPGAIGLSCLLIALLLFAPFPARLRGPALGALLSLAGICVWTLVSALWSPAPDVGVEDSQRVFAYVLCFSLGLWICSLLGRRKLLALAPLAAGGALVSVATLITLATSTDVVELLETDATLRYPIGYRNAVAAFFLMAMLASVTLAAAPRELDWRLRGLLNGSATLAIELAVISQSRSSVFAAVAGLVVLVALHPARLRILGWLCLVVLPVLPALPWLLDVFQSNGANTEASLEPLGSAANAMALTSFLSVLVGWLAAWRDPLIRISEEKSRLLGRTLAAGAVVLAVVGAVVLAVKVGSPTDFIDRQADELSAGSPDLSSKGSRFGLDLRSERGDFWRVAVDDLVDDPLAGEGAGGWRFSYLREREEIIQPEDPHNVFMLMASELGLPGVILFLTFIVSAAWAALRSRRAGPEAAALVAGALAIGAYWLVHASAEWFWSYAVITVPMAYALGAAAAPASSAPERHAIKGRAGRIAIAVATGAAALSLVPFFLAERYTDDGIRAGGSDPEAAYESLDRAVDLNPLTDRALAAEAVIAAANGDRDRALSALDAAQERQPEEWTLYFLEARTLAETDPVGARAALRRAHQLNPLSPEIKELGATIRAQQGV
jgi:hypothetical protein